MTYIAYERGDTLIAKLARAKGVTVICRAEGTARTYLTLRPGHRPLSYFQDTDSYGTFWDSEEEILSDLLPICDEPSKVLLSALNLCPESTLKEEFDWCDAYKGPYFPTAAALTAHIETR